jgi:proteasome lid subunit RPN8/RPN11
MKIKITRVVLEKLKEDAESAYPEEGCGLLLAKSLARDEILGWERTKNTYEGPKDDRYAIDPLELLRADRFAGRRGFIVSGIYHSHPDHPAKPSKFDLEHAFPWYHYVIVSVVNGIANDVRAWILSKDRIAFMEESLFLVTTK